VSDLRLCEQFCILLCFPAFTIAGLTIFGGKNIFYLLTAKKWGLNYQKTNDLFEKKKNWFKQKENVFFWVIL
jgi:hypothetical protein